MIINGTVAAGFESVKSLYEQRMATFEEKNTQLCVYVGDERVVDLWASVDEEPDFSADSITNVFSSSKNLEAIAMAALAGQGLLDYNANVADYWPEFAAHGKGSTTVAQVMRHEAGLTAFDHTLAATDLHPQNIRQNRIGAVIEQQAQKFPAGEGNRREYHAITRGWIVNEIFRRIDPQGRTIGEFIRAEISTPLAADVYLGLTDAEHARIARITSPGVGFQLAQSFKSRSMGRRTDLNILQTLRKLSHVIPMARRSSRRGSPPAVEGLNLLDFWYDRQITLGEIPSANANCSARGLAKLAAALANEGQFDNQQVLSPAAWQALHAQPVPASMGFPTTFTQGGVALFSQSGPKAGYFQRALNDGREGFYGWMGAGGSIFQWHPQHKIGFGYVPTSMNFFDFLNERGKAYQAEVLRCVGA